MADIQQTQSGGDSTPVPPADDGLNSGANEFREELAKANFATLTDKTAAILRRALNLGPDSAFFEAARDYVLESAKTKISSMNSNAVKLIADLLNRQADVAQAFVLGEGIEFAAKEQTAVNEKLTEILGRDLSHARDSILLLREVFSLFRGEQAAKDEGPLPAELASKIPLKGNALTILEKVAAISNTKIKYTPESDEINNDRLLRGGMTTRVLRAIRRDAGTVTRMVAALQVMASYDNDLGLLSEFLDKAGTSNPYRATEVMHYESRHARDLPGEILNEVTEEWGNDAAGKRIPVVCKGASGTYLVESGELHLAHSSLVPGSVFVAKRQAALGPFRHWRPEVYNEAKSEVQKKARQKKTKEASPKLNLSDFDEIRLSELVAEAEYKQFGISELEDVSLAELESSNKYQEIAQKSPILARDLELYRELRAAIQELKSDANRLVRGELALKVLEGTHRTLADPGGRLMGNIARRLKEETPGVGAVPDWVKSSYSKLNNADVILTDKQEQLIIQGLLAWDALNSDMDRGMAFDGVISDMDLYDEMKAMAASFPADHPIQSAEFDFAARRLGYQDKLVGSVRVGKVIISSKVRRLGISEKFSMSIC